MNIETAASQLEALGNTTRLTIYRTLVRAGQNGMPVGKLQLKLDIAGSTLSHHIKKLVEVNLVSQERQATTLICRANYSSMNGLIGYLADECCADGSCAADTPEAAA
jgi:ArsR family transcriptional regulator, arsenate/arsenite/antimonite-responsive transcriptional repressor